MVGVVLVGWVCWRCCLRHGGSSVWTRLLSSCPFFQVIIMGLFSTKYNNVSTFEKPVKVRCMECAAWFVC